SEPNRVAAANTRADLMNIVHTPKLVAIAEPLLSNLADFWLLPSDGYGLCGEAIHRLSYIPWNVYRRSRRQENNPADVVPDSTHYIVSNRCRLRFPQCRMNGWASLMAPHGRR